MKETESSATAEAYDLISCLYHDTNEMIYEIAKRNAIRRMSKLQNGEFDILINSDDVRLARYQIPQVLLPY